MTCLHNDSQRNCANIVCLSQCACNSPKQQQWKLCTSYVTLVLFPDWTLSLSCLKPRRAPPCHTACVHVWLAMRYKNSSCSACHPGASRPRIHACMAFRCGAQLTWLSGWSKTWLYAKNKGHTMFVCNVLNPETSMEQAQTILNTFLFILFTYVHIRGTLIDKKGVQAVLHRSHGCLALMFH